MIDIEKKEATSKEELCKHCKFSRSYHGNAGLKDYPSILKWYFSCTYRGKVVHAQTDVYYCSTFEPSTIKNL